MSRPQVAADARSRCETKPRSNALQLSEDCPASGASERGRCLALVKSFCAETRLSRLEISAILGAEPLKSRSFVTSFRDVYRKILAGGLGEDRDDGRECEADGDPRRLVAFRIAKRLVDRECDKRQSAPKGKQGVTKSPRLQAHDARQALAELNASAVWKDHASIIAARSAGRDKCPGERQSALDSPQMFEHESVDESRRKSSECRSKKRKRPVRTAGDDSGSEGRNRKEPQCMCARRRTSASRGVPRQADDSSDGSRYTTEIGTERGSSSPSSVNPDGDDGSSWSSPDVLVSTDVHQPDTSSIVIPSKGATGVRKQLIPNTRTRWRETTPDRGATQYRTPAVTASSSHGSGLPSFEDSACIDLTSRPDPPWTEATEDPGKQSAVRSLADGQWLTTTAVLHGAALFNPSGKVWHVPEPVVVTGGGSPRRRLESSHQDIVVFVNWHSSHWTVGITFTATGEVCLYDPLHRESYIDGTFDRVVALAPSLPGRGWRRSAGRSQLKQDNSDDCGIYAIVFAAYTMCGEPLPSRIVPEVWRALLAETLAPSAEVKPLFNTSPAQGTTSMAREIVSRQKREWTKPLALLQKRVMEYEQKKAAVRALLREPHSLSLPGQRMASQAIAYSKFQQAACGWAIEKLTAAC
ncbi:uncharacterized protein LTR77_010995 [Saxophila tyrrhenica]|uniref:Ubiquitin-like protease family profile domain-containing protein n=1 Tax=Saxophila tyrrhenica TaxID=1690608 RepID=A0AAV9NWK6_9PEZI|nr:hypothetical protein LTR77_010995 [Saxophila tyrrhenica]